jgi:hypothetical protein
VTTIAKSLGCCPNTSKLRRPCTSCPWRVDAPHGHWDPLHFSDIWRHCQDDGTHIMLCHKSKLLEKRGSAPKPCQGWIRVMGYAAIGVRILVMRGQASHEEVVDRDGPELFPTFTAMMHANKIRLPKRSRMIP